MDDAHSYYLLTKYGTYSAQVFTSLEIFSSYYADTTTGDLLSFMDDPGRRNFDPLTSNKISFSITPSQPIAQSPIEAKFSLLQIDQGTKPRTTETSLVNRPIYLYRQADIPRDFYPIGFKTYELICAQVEPKALKYTDPQGIARFPGISQDDYFLISIYSQSQDFIYVGAPINATDPEWATGQVIVRNLTVLEKANGKTVPGKTIKRQGSELLITQPEFVLWDGSQELYPFVFKTAGDWSVNTAINPPQGFVSDYKSLNADVRSELETIQFTISNVGSRWEETDVTYQIEHKGKKEVIKSKIGIKLSKKLAEKKRLEIYGHTESPGTFVGGKKVKETSKK
jgi:hypothetical protein